jgi:hypothetical protein
MMRLLLKMIQVNLKRINQKKKVKIFWKLLIRIIG